MPRTLFPVFAIDTVIGEVDSVSASCFYNAGQACHAKEKPFQAEK